MGEENKVITIHDRIPKLKEQRRQKANRRLIFFISIFFILIMTVIYYQSPLSYVQNIEVIGNQNVTSETIIEKSGITSDTNLWSIDTSNIEMFILEMDEVASVRAQRKFPNNVVITIEEYKRIAYLFNEGKYYPILETGRFLDELPRDVYPVDAPILVDWDQGNIVEELAIELTKIPEGILNRISEVFHTPLENDPSRIIIYMNDGNKVYSTVKNFAERIAPYPSIVSELEPDQKGIIHMRMTPYFEQIEEDLHSESEG